MIAPGPQCHRGAGPPPVYVSLAGCTFTIAFTI
nr:MAG TPA: hypothetical protein [Caudoviricetes sp.]